MLRVIKSKFQIISIMSPLFLHSLIGIIIGYFILHPLTMIIYWFEINKVSITQTTLSSVIMERISHTFHLHMMPMSIAFIILGLIAGLFSGLYYTSIKRKNLTISKHEKLLQKSIPSLIKEGENELVEFKSSLRFDCVQQKINKDLENIIIKTIAGFLNAQGGILLIGLDDNGLILGLEKDYQSLKIKNKDGFEQRLILLISNNFGKDVCSRIHITFHRFSTNELCSVIIEASLKPVYVKTNDRTLFYLRTGNVTNPLTTKETVEYLNIHT